MTHEWKPADGSTAIRADNETGDHPGFWKQSLSGDWRPLYGGAGEIDATEEMLRLAELVQDQAERIRLVEAGEVCAVDDAMRLTQEIRLLRKERRLLIDLDKARGALIGGMFHGEIRQSQLDEIERNHALILALHAEARGGVLLPEGVPCGCLLCAPKRDLGADAPLLEAGPPDDGSTARAGRAGLLHGDPESMDEVTARRQAEAEPEEES